MNIKSPSAAYLNSFSSSLRRVYTFTFNVVSLFAAICLINFAAAAQDGSTQNTEPPPLKILSKNEKTLLDGETDIKKRTKLALVLMETRMKNAETLDGEDRFAEMYQEFGKLHALMDDTLNFLNRNDNGRDKVLDNFKRFELGIRAFAPRLENVRRNLPVRYEPYVKTLIRAIRDTRSKAVEAFYENSSAPNVRQQ